MTTTLSRTMTVLADRVPDAQVRRGLLIDAARPIEFYFEGRKYQGLQGDTIASALAANGVWLLARSFKYHRPRGVRSMAGLEADPMVQLEHEPNVQADSYPISPGLRVYGQNYLGSLRNDRQAIIGHFSSFLPVGFYYKAFYSPQGIWQRVWEPLFRRGAGLGRVNLGTPRPYYDKSYRFHDVVVVGSGPAGLSAAITAARAGAEVLLVEQENALGGSLNYFRADVDDRDRERMRDRLLAELEALPSIEVMTGATCNAWYADNWLPVIRGNRLYKCRAKELVLATGFMEQPAVFSNNDLPGIMLGSGAQRLLKLYGVKPGRRGVVLTGNAAGYAVALDLHDAGVEIGAVVDMRGGNGDAPVSAADEALQAEVRRRGIRVETEVTVVEAIATSGNRHIAAVRIAPITGRGGHAPGGTVIDCDLLCMSVGYMPAYQLALQAGGRLRYDDDSSLFHIDGTPPHVYLAGCMDGVYALRAARVSGQRAGWRAAESLGLEAGEEPRLPADRGQGGINHPWPMFPRPGGKAFVDLDEDLHYADIVNACADGYAELELVKRYSTVGMGPSQGRHSALCTARIVAAETGRTVSETGVTTARPPLAAEKLGVLAGRAFEPERLTPLHYRHLEAGATMMNVGLWWRPAYYGRRDDRTACIRSEVLAVRNNVGLIDVSTLGKIRLRGADAAQFLNRMYTFAYLKQPVGRARYLLMTNEAGTVTDDGVAVRLAEDSFYVTATTGGADAVYRSMLWWNAQWRLNVDIANVTAAFAAVNIAGPASRDVLQRLCQDVDLSAAAFGPNEARTGTVAGIPAYLVRVSFVGELGYEIHVPASCGEALWDRLMEAGVRQDIRPVGIEAQRNLRLEKGHIIVGQDTDAMTCPEECGMGWAVKFDKPFFVGKRSLEIRAKHPSGRRLVGFEIKDPAAGMPEESNLVLEGGSIAGHVTSVARSPVLNTIIGMAWAGAEKQPGHRISIKLTDGRVVDAAVVRMPFYDPENRRQEL